MYPAQAAGMAGVDIFLGVVIQIGRQRKGRASLMRVEIEEVGALDADEVVGRGWSATVDVSTSQEDGKMRRTQQFQ
jgi:hypothetical protein